MWDTSIRPAVFVKADQLPFVAACLCSLFFTGFEGPLFFLSQLCLFAFLISRLASASGRILLPVSGFSLLLLLFFCCSALTLFWTPVPGYTQAMLWRQGSPLLIFLALLLLPEEEDYWAGMQTVLVLLALVAAVWAIGQFCLGGQPRAGFLNRNSLAGFLLPLAFWVLGKEVVGWRRILFSGALFCSGVALGLIGSRGALLALLIGLLCLWGGLGRLRIGGGRLFRRIALLCMGLLLSLIVTGLDVGRGLGRLGSLGDPLAAGADRIVIWQASWEMLQDAPWYGIGVGIYGLVYPQYRYDGDASAGHFAHNDLLQVAIETGLPGFLLLVAMIFCLVFLIRRGLRQMPLGSAKRLELSGLAAGLMAVAFHSMFTFNFYIYATLLVVAVVLARSYFLLPQAGLLRLIDLNRFGRKMKYLLVAFCLLPVTVLGLHGASQLATERALALLGEDRPTESFRYLNIAKNFWPTNDFNWYMEGEALRLGLATGVSDVADRQYLFERARTAFAKAAELNPYRAAVPHKLGLLARRATGEESANVNRLYRQALKIDPRYFPARIDLALSYLRENRPERAKELVEDGLNYYYQNVPGLIPYLDIAARLRAQSGDRNGADELLQRIRNIRESWQDQG